jgi:protein phosphatase
MPSPEQSAWRVASKTDTGRVRAHNEDSFGTFEHASGARLLVVADGMGGHRGGATASRLAVEALGAALERTDDPSEAWLAEAIRAANRDVHRASLLDPELRGMGTTLVAALIDEGGRAWIAHVGDSRAYLVRGDRLEALTEDHSVVAEMIRRGLLTPDEAATHPRRNEILRSVGVETDVEPDLRELELAPDDVLLLCSDGLCGVVSDDEIERIATGHTPEEGVERMIAAANERGGPDNITAVIARAPRELSAARSDGGASATALALIVSLVGALGVFAFRLWL